ncbi:hypothetical protein GS896_27455 [Rhodococcus hoagii]|nr:hypothetical protein [Prescottella equi]MBM4570222.1 hypothetical protein [Prescottella equi]MBM4570241.1 hypothetical protein [Prescottella equi]MBM4574797.1 hypothetical protein [Prescottella equi]MBM4653989.1 hypothetical protein [Prescottella equi]
MTLHLKLGDKVLSKGRKLTVTETDLTTLAKMRPFLIAAATRGTTVTYGDILHALDLPYPPNGLGRILDLLSEDCVRRGEYSLAALAVSKATGEVGSSFAGDAAQERGLLYGFWQSRSAG